MWIDVTMTIDFKWMFCHLDIDSSYDISKEFQVMQTKMNL